MPVTDHLQRLPVESLFVRRDERQRRELLTPEGNFINKDGLLESVKLHGILSPILAHRSGEIIFGERRWTAAKLAGLPDVPVRFVEDLPALDARIIELEENVRRSDLGWRDYVVAVQGLHESYVSRAAESGATWSQRATSQELALSEGRIARILRVAEDLDSPRVAKCASLHEAINALERIDERASAAVLEDIISGSAESLQSLMGGAASGAVGVSDDHDPDDPSMPGGENNAPRIASAAGFGGGLADHPGVTVRPGPSSIAYPGTPLYMAPQPGETDSIIGADFAQWAATYAGPRFQLIHCDFPYGVGLFGGKWGGKDNVEAYEDTQDVYEKLIRALCENIDRLMAHSGHLVFWLSADMDILAKTKRMFAELAGDLWFLPMPLIWHKTDNMGIVSDPQRRMRHVYEMALVATREDRKICKVVSDCYGAPTDKRLHPSCKPEPVLKHFLAAFVDEHTRMLDPTCGSGSSLRAAEALGAESVLGLELDPQHVDSARAAMRQFRALRALERTVATPKSTVSAA